GRTVLEHSPRAARGAGVPVLREASGRPERESRDASDAARSGAWGARDKALRGRATSFYYSFLALPVDKRNAIVAVWDFCRAVDDAVDEPGDRDPASALAQWRTELARLYDGKEPQTPQGKHLAPVITAFALPRSGF